MMPAHNASRYLEATVVSILNQTYTNWELVFVDDGSTDGTLDVIRALADKDARIRVFAMPHGGRGRARNTCLENVRGEFVAVCDSDDISFPERFEKQINYLLSHPEIGAVGSWWIPFSSELPMFNEPVRKAPTSPIALRASFQRGKMRFHNATVMLRSKLFKQYGGYDVEQKRAQDYEFFSRISKCGVLFSALPEPLIYYRQESEIVSRKYFCQSNMYIAYANRPSGDRSKTFEIFSLSLSGRIWGIFYSIKYFYFYFKMLGLKFLNL